MKGGEKALGVGSAEQKVKNGSPEHSHRPNENDSFQSWIKSVTLALLML